MCSKPRWRELILRYEVPPLPRTSAREKIALVIGSGLGTGFIKPCAPSWGSIPGFLFFIAASGMPHLWGAVLFAAVLPAAIWSGTVCEGLLGRKDPRAVVIDEVAAAPVALWPLWFHWPIHAVTWVVIFGVYRLADYLKPWPANRLQSLKGGLGILIDDLISSLYVALALLAAIRFIPAWV